jgi:ribonuclease P protein component
LLFQKTKILKTYLNKKKISNKYITLFFGVLKNKNNKKLNISFVTKKKQIKSAVKRNKVKRRLRNIMNDLVKKISINFNLSYLVMAKTTMLNNDYQVIKETLFQDFKKIK